MSSSARAVTAGRRPHPLYMVRGKGSRIQDADGRWYIDHLLGYGSAVLGHADRGVTNAIAAQLTAGMMFGTCNTLEVELAEKIRAMVPCADLVRFASSGSEAVCAAVRIARGWTGRVKVLKFEGHYHGWVDVLAVSNRPPLSEAGPADRPTGLPHSRGIPPGVADDVVICPWNDPQALRAILDARPGQFAAVIAEPIVANNACIMPRDGFLSTLREECDRRGIVLIFDEIVTGFRVAPGGAQALFGVTPDLAVYSKAVGGGTPLSAICGRRVYMEPVAQNVIKHGGTYNGNPLCAAAALETLRRLASPGALSQIEGRGQALIDAIRRAARDRGVACVVQGLGSMFQVVFGLERPARNYRELVGADTDRFARFASALLDGGVLINASGSACWFVSAAHTGADVEETTRAIERAMAAAA